MTCDAICTGPNVSPGSAIRDVNGDGRYESLVQTSIGVYMESTSVGAVPTRIIYSDRSHGYVGSNNVVYGIFSEFTVGNFLFSEIRSSLYRE